MKEKTRKLRSVLDKLFVGGGGVLEVPELANYFTQITLK